MAPNLIDKLLSYYVMNSSAYCACAESNRTYPTSPEDSACCSLCGLRCTRKLTTEITEARAVTCVVDLGVRIEPNVSEILRTDFNVVLEPGRYVVISV